MGWLSDLFTSKTENTQTRTDQITPWKPVSGALEQLGANASASMPNGLTGREKTAINQWGNLGAKGHQFANQYGQVANGLLTPTDYGGYAKDAYSDLQSNLGGYASGAMLDPANNPYFAGLMTQLGDSAANRINSSFAAAGRDFSGANQNSVAQGITEAQLPVLAQMYGQNQDRQFQANSMLQGAGYGLSGLLSDLDTAEGNRQLAGIQAGNSAMDARLWGPQTTLNAEAARRQIPLQSYQGYAGLLGGLGQQFGTGTANQTTETSNTPSAFSVVSDIAKMAGTIMTGIPMGGGSSGGGTTAPSGASFMPSLFQGSAPGGGTAYSYSPYGGQNNPYANYSTTGQVGANPFYLGAY